MTDKAKLSEPEVLLESYKPHLNVSGCIRDSSQILWLINKMRTATKLIDKYILLHVLQLTCDSASKLVDDDSSEDLLERFLNSGGWSVLNSWLMDFMNNKNNAFISLMIKVLHSIPVSIDLLKMGNMGKLVKKASKISYQNISEDSKDLINSWKSLIITKNESTVVSDLQSEDIPNKEIFATGDGLKIHFNKKEKQIGSGRIMLIDPLPSDDALSENGKGHTAGGKFNTQLSKFGTSSLLDEIMESQDKLKLSSIRVPDHLSKLSKTLAESTRKVEPPSKEYLKAKSKKTSSKSVRWKPDDNLTQVLVFEPYEEERKVQHDHGDFSEARQQELLHEGITMKMARSSNPTDDTPIKKWRKPSELNVEENFVVKIGESSVERNLQKHRESEKVAVVYFKPEQIPYSPAEASILTPSESPNLEFHNDSQEKTPNQEIKSSITALSIVSTRDNVVLIPTDHNGDVSCPEWPSEYWIRYLMDSYRTPTETAQNQPENVFHPANNDAFEKKKGHISATSHSDPSNPYYQNAYVPRGPAPLYSRSQYHEYGRPRDFLQFQSRQPVYQHVSRSMHQSNSIRPHPEDDILMPPNEHYDDDPAFGFLPFEKEIRPPSHHSSFYQTRPYNNQRLPQSPYQFHGRSNISFRPPAPTYRTVCRHFIGRGCRNGDNCRFYHPPS